MKKILFVIALTVIGFSLGVFNVPAQVTPDKAQSIDERIKAAEEENAKLLKLKEILDKNNKLKTELGIDTRSQVNSGETTVGTTNPSTPQVTTPPIATKTNSDSQSGSDNTARGFTLPNKVPAANTLPVGNNGADTTGNSTAILKLDDPMRDAIRKSEICEKIIRDLPDVNTNDMNVCNLAQRILVGANFALDPSANKVEITKAIAGKFVEQPFPNPLTPKQILEFQAKRTDKQVGSAVNKSGVTNLVNRASIPYIMSLAAENGAAVATATGTTINFKFNPVGTVEYLNKRSSDQFGIKPIDTNQPFVKQLRRTAFGISYDTARGVETPMFTGSRDQLSGFSFSYSLLDERSPTSNVYKLRSEEFIRTYGNKFHADTVSKLQLLFDPTGKHSALINKFVEETNVVIRPAAQGINVETNAESKVKMLFDVLRKQFTKVPVEEIKADSVVFETLKSFRADADTYSKGFNEMQRKLNRSKLFTMDYNYNRTFTASDTSRIGGVFEKGWENGTEFIFDSSFTFFHSPLIRTIPVTGAVATPINQRRLRDFSFAMQYDVPLTGLSSSIGQSTLSFAAKYQRMLTDSVQLFDGTVVNGVKGDIVVGQAKVQLPVFGGFFLPLSFTYANRPELIKEKKSRGNFGFTFDLSSLLERFSPIK